MPTPQVVATWLSSALDEDKKTAECHLCNGLLLGRIAFSVSDPLALADAINAARLGDGPPLVS
ncbi:hypothetical protein C8E87_5548 [Paractinoplanes brasiliensis]|uniref:Uncharacterized protein n=1 Tax=Paractinoplanes brasiliensis TaxID=52695 RepID=A0A4R6JY76_9ACTN|nr:hypothetical protein C8E87_5548 [Actinoplanes brasiliensis]GID29925.1 hypothetical protein Abr02nite_49080 [Actinoplanes brasiliensis]